MRRSPNDDVHYLSSNPAKEQSAEANGGTRSASAMTNQCTTGSNNDTTGDGVDDHEADENPAEGQELSPGQSLRDNRLSL